MEHEISTIHILHDEEQVLLGVEAGVEASEEWRLLLHGQHPAFIQRALHVILLDNQILLQALNGVYFLGTLVFSQEYLLANKEMIQLPMEDKKKEKYAQGETHIYEEDSTTPSGRCIFCLSIWLFYQLITCSFEVCFS